MAPVRNTPKRKAKTEANKRLKSLSNYDGHMIGEDARARRLMKSKIDYGPKVPKKKKQKKGNRRYFGKLPEPTYGTARQFAEPLEPEQIYVDSTYASPPVYQNKPKTQHVQLTEAMEPEVKTPSKIRMTEKQFQRVKQCNTCCENKKAIACKGCSDEQINYLKDNHDKPPNCKRMLNIPRCDECCTQQEGYKCEGCTMNKLIELRSQNIKNPKCRK